MCPISPSGAGPGSSVAVSLTTSDDFQSHVEADIHSAEQEWLVWPDSRSTWFGCGLRVIAHGFQCIV